MSGRGHRQPAGKPQNPTCTRIEGDKNKVTCGTHWKCERSSGFANPLAEVSFDTFSPADTDELDDENSPKFFAEPDSVPAFGDLPIEHNGKASTSYQSYEMILDARMERLAAALPEEFRGSCKVSMLAGAIAYIELLEQQIRPPLSLDSPTPQAQMQFSAKMGGSACDQPFSAVSGLASALFY